MIDQFSKTAASKINGRLNDLVKINNNLVESVQIVKNKITGLENKVRVRDAKIIALDDDVDLLKKRCAVLEDSIGE